MLEIIKSFLSIFGIGMQNARDAENKADGARKAEIERRDKMDEIRHDKDEHRKKTADRSDDDVIGSL